MNDLIFAASVRDNLASYRDDLPQGLLLHGELGVGLLTAALYLAGSRTVITIQPIAQTPTAQPAIAIETVRQLYETTRTKSLVEHVIVIDDADLMTIPAQQAFLKLLEEPQAHVRFILTSHKPENLLKTIRSRVQQFHLPRLSTEQTDEFISRIAPSKQAQLKFAASGRPALIARLSSDEALFRVYSSTVADAKQFLSEKAYQRLAIALKYASNKHDARRLLDVSIEILRHSMYTSPNLEYLKLIEKYDDTLEKLAGNYSPKLQLIRLVVQ